MNISTILNSKSNNKHSLDRYIKLIENLSSQTIEGPYEIHHICPKANDLFPEYKNLKDHPWNSVKLTPRQHFVAHLILWKTYGGSQSQAFWFMANKRTLTSRLYESLKTERSKVHSDKLTGVKRGPNSTEANENIRAAAKNRKHTYKKHSAEIIEKIKSNHSRPWSGKHHSQETKTKISKPGAKNPMFGKKHSKETIEIQKKNRSMFVYQTPWGNFSSISSLSDNPYNTSGNTIASLCSNNKLLTLLSAKRIGLPIEWVGKTTLDLGFKRVAKDSIV